MSTCSFQLNSFSVTFRRLNWDWVGVKKGGEWTEIKSGAATLDLFNLLYRLVNEPRSFAAKPPPTPHVYPALVVCPPLYCFGYFSLPLAISFSQSSVFLFVDFILFSDSLKDPLLVSSGGGTSWL